ncbi:MAG: CHASE2 domain-containing protein, partial [Cyanobacteria bacterium J06553_1]
AASWLPVICQNPSVAESLTWASLKASFAEDRKTRRWKQLGKFLAVSAIASTLVIGAREAKLLQPIELRAYDHLMRRRPLEEPDERLLLITVTEADVQAQTDKEMSLSNQSLELLLNRLAPSNPRLIGLDIYRTVSAKGQYPDLLDELQNNDRLITTCDVGKGTANNLGIPPSPDITSHIPADQPERRAEQLTNRVGFSDSVTDIDGVTRRQLYGTLPPRESPCQADNSFNILLALGYLAEEGIEPELLEDDSLKIGDVILPNFLANTGSYQGAEMSGYQLMTNYRALESLSDIAETLTLDEVLTGDLLPEDLSDRIVLIGTTAPSYQDRKETPYELDTPGVVIQAHQISQILSAVLENRPLISDWPQWAENVWIFAWAAAGGLSLWIINKQRFAILVWVGGSGIVYAVGYGLMTQAVWIPLIPPMLALLLTCILVSVLLENKEKIKE